MKIKNFPYSRNQLLHPLWLDKVELILQRDNFKCVICGFPVNDKRYYRPRDKNKRELVIHFKQHLFDIKLNMYVEPWKYPNNLLVTFDSWCQEKGNLHFNIPIKKIN